jgi:hypothetical protein
MFNPQDEVATPAVNSLNGSIRFTQAQQMGLEQTNFFLYSPNFNST